MLTGLQFDIQARSMVEIQLRRRGIRDERVLDAMRLVPRHEFVPLELESAAYDDRPLPIGQHETISQPYMVAAMTEAAGVASGDKALEIGAGSGYQAAILAQLGASVYAVELNPRLASVARERLQRLGYRHVEVIAGDGSEGLASHAPYDAIIVSAGTPQLVAPSDRPIGGRRPPGSSGGRSAISGATAAFKAWRRNYHSASGPLPICAAGRKRGMGGSGPVTSDKF